MSISIELAAAVFSVTVTIILALVGTLWHGQDQRMGKLEAACKENGKVRDGELKAVASDHVTEKLCDARMDGVRAEIAGLSDKIDQGFADLRETTGRIWTHLNGRD